MYGEIPGIPSGTTFASRRELFDAGVHRTLQAGIWPWGPGAAESIVISGGYEDDEDYGDLIIYTGHGGNDPSTRQQVADQHFDRGNEALAKNSIESIPVRVVRAIAARSGRGRATGYRYDGLFNVGRYWQEPGKSGFLVCRYRLVSADRPLAIENDPPATETRPAPRAETTGQRILRRAEVVLAVKAYYDHCCQVCGLRLETPLGPYAEGAHIRPLGRPHDGPDIESNVLCLCPNDHVRFDQGAIFVDDDGRIVSRLNGSIVGELRVAAAHRVDSLFLQYHRSMHEVG